MKMEMLDDFHKQNSSLKFFWYFRENEKGIFISTSALYTLKVHKHEIFLYFFLQKPKPYGPEGL
jgi:hypothetical protein